MWRRLIFWTTLERFEDIPALVWDHGSETYRGLARRSQAVANSLGPDRLLVFLEARNTLDSISQYLGCLLGEHATYLFSPDDKEKIDTLAALYQPNLVIRGSEWGWRDSRRHALHRDLRVLLSTSGSTGSPKLVKLSSRNIDSNATSIASYLELGPDCRAASTLQFNYSYGMSVINSHLAPGGSVYLTERSISDPSFWSAFAEHGATSWAGVPYSFDLLDKSGSAWVSAPGLRQVTQAGGRLPPERVRGLAQEGRKNGWRFYVMYGQTEASPRMAYLPPDLAETYPNCIGRPIPGGELALLEDDGREISVPDVPGQLVYRGPNVMLGYASDVNDLSSAVDADHLLTGDVGARNAAGLFYIVGRLSRIVKPYGLRINLDEVEQSIQVVLPGAVCTGSDSAIVIAHELFKSSSEIDAIKGSVASRLKIPSYAIRLVGFAEIPKLASGKYDYRRILAASEANDDASGTGSDLPAGVSFLAAWLGQFWTELRSIVGADVRQWDSAKAIFEEVLAIDRVDQTKSFSDLRGDSLTYVQLSLALEGYLGALPQEWEHLTVSDLEELRSRATPL